MFLKWIAFTFSKTMENEQRHYELRSGSRSRSRTPLVQQSGTTTIEPETLEHHYHLRNLSRERSRTPGEIANVKRPGRILYALKASVLDYRWIWLFINTNIRILNFNLSL